MTILQRIIIDASQRLIKEIETNKSCYNNKTRHLLFILEVNMVRCDVSAI